MNDSELLLKEAAKNCLYASRAIKIAKDYATDRGLIMALDKYRDEHEEIRKKLDDRIKTEEALHASALFPKKGKKSSAGDAMVSMGSAMNGMHISMSLSLNRESDNIAKLIINGCNTGMKNISKQKNRHPNASAESICLANHLIKTEQSMVDDMLRYLK